MAVAELASFSQAGRRLSVEQSTVSRRIRSLEERLGVALFERGPFGIELTQAGRLFLARLTRSRSLLSDALSEARRTGAAETGVLKLGSAWTFAAGRAQILAATFRERQAGVRLLLTERGPAELIARLLGGDLDCALVDPGSTFEPSLCVEPLWRERVYLASAAEGPLSLPTRSCCAEPPTTVSASPAGSAPEALGPSNSGTRLLPRKPARPRGLGRGRHPRAGEGVAALGADGVRFSPAPEPDAYAQVSAVWRRENGNPALGRFIGLTRRLQALAAGSHLFPDPGEGGAAAARPAP